MQSSVIGKVEKARRYAEEKDRVTFSNFRLSFRGDHNDYVVNYKGGGWDCTCSFFPLYGFCSHTMAVERILQEMVPALGSTPASNGNCK